MLLDARYDMKPQKNAVPIAGGISPLCKDAFNKVVGMNVMKQFVGSIGSDLGEMAGSGLFEKEEVKMIGESYKNFAGEIGSILKRKFAFVGQLYDDCLKREMRNNIGSNISM